MKIVQLTAENIKRLKAVEIQPNGAVVTIAGRNGQGKTSIMDSIEWALHGLQSVQAMPIRKGEKRGVITLTLGDREPKLTVRRTFTEKGSALHVESPDGAIYKSPQALLDRLIGALSFDPLAFARMDAKQQFDELRRVAKIEVDIDHLKAQNEGDFVKRTDINREIRALRAQYDGVVVPFENEDLKPADETALVDELEKAGEQNRAIEKARSHREASRNIAAQKREGVALTTSRATQLRLDADRAHEQAGAIALEAYEMAKKRAAAALKAALTKIEEMEADAKREAALAAQIDAALAAEPQLADPVDTKAIRAKMDEARQINAALHERQKAVTQRESLKRQAGDMERQSIVITDRIENRDKTIAAAIAGAAMPIDGIGFGDGNVLYNGIPFEQISSAEQLRVSMAIAMAANPKLRVIRITDGSLLDDESLTAIGDMARDKDFQIWLERVDGSGKVGIVIEDGEVASTPESRAEVDDAIAAHPEYADDGVKGFPHGEGHTA